MVVDPPWSAKQQLSVPDLRGNFLYFSFGSNAAYRHLNLNVGIRIYTGP
jgi:hypothetical protein